MLLNYRKFLSLNILMATRNMFFKGTYLPRTQLLSSRTYSKLLFSNHPSKPTSKSSPFLIKSCGVSYTPHARAYSPGIIQETHDCFFVCLSFLFLFLFCMYVLIHEFDGVVKVVVAVCFFLFFYSGSGEWRGWCRKFYEVEYIE